MKQTINRVEPAGIRKAVEELWKERNCDVPSLPSLPKVERVLKCRKNVRYNQPASSVFPPLNRCFPFWNDWQAHSFCITRLLSSGYRVRARPKGGVGGYMPGNQYWSRPLSLPSVINVKFLLQPHQKWTPHSIKNLAFHSLLSREMTILPILPTSLIHLSLKGWENVLCTLAGLSAFRRRQYFRYPRDMHQFWGFDIYSHAYTGNRWWCNVNPINIVAKTERK